MLPRSMTQAISQVVTNPLIVGLAVMLCVGPLAYRVFSLTGVGEASVLPVTSSTTAKNPTNQANSLNHSQLAALNLFGKAKINSSAEQKPAQEDIPQTRLKLTLQGAFTSTANEVSSALIATDKRSKAQRYYIGDEVPGNAILHEVTAHNVVLKRGGKLEKLLFPREQGIASNRSEAGSLRSAPIRSQRQQPRTVIDVNEQSLKNRLQQLREQLNQDEDNIRI